MTPPAPISTQALPRTIGFWAGTGVMVGIIVGSGIFRTPPDIAGVLGSPWLILCLWVVGGAVSLLGALTYAELATMFPESGGVYVFLREGYGRPMAFVFGWTYMLITKPMAAAGIAVVFSENINRLLGVEWRPDLTTCAILVILTAINTAGMRLGAGIATALTALKVGALVAIVLLCLLLQKGSWSGFAGSATATPLWSGILIAMTGILWTYDGWSDVGAIAGEVREPQRMLPRIYIVGTVVMIGIYAAVNAAYFSMVPLEQMRSVDSVAPVVMERLTGANAAALVTLIIVISAMGSTHGSIITGARVTYAQASDGLMFRFLSHVHPVFRTPDTALWTQCALSCAAVLWLQDFGKLAGGFVFTMWIFYGLAGSAIFIMRRRRPDAQRSFRCPGYPVVPGLFVLSAIAMTVGELARGPRGTLPWLGVLAAGWPVYWVWLRLAKPPARMI